MLSHSKKMYCVLMGLSLVATVGCSSLETPATTNVAVTNAAVESAVAAGGSQFAPVEMNAARSKLALAREAFARKDYSLAINLADQARADAKLAQAKAQASKARAAANLLEDDIQILRNEIKRNTP